MRGPRLRRHRRPGSVSLDDAQPRRVGLASGLRRGEAAGEELGISLVERSAPGHARRRPRRHAVPVVARRRGGAGHRRLRGRGRSDHQDHRLLARGRHDVQLGASMWSSAGDRPGGFGEESAPGSAGDRRNSSVLPVPAAVISATRWSARDQGEDVAARVNVRRQDKDLGDALRSPCRLRFSKRGAGRKRLDGRCDAAARLVGRPTDTAPGVERVVPVDSAPPSWSAAARICSTAW